jgi:hypothetical protein
MMRALGFAERGLGAVRLAAWAMAAARVVPFALIAMACSHAAPGISREKAEAVLKAFDYTDMDLQADPNGWSGTAIPASGGYRLRVSVDRNGALQLRPCDCGGREMPST